MKPPALAAAALALLYPEPLLEAVAGDLEEEFQRRVRQEGCAPARGWYWRQVAASSGPALARRWQHGDAAALLLLAALTGGLFWLIERAGRYTLSQVPLKAGETLPLVFDAGRWVAGALVSGLGVYWWRHDAGRRGRTK